MVLESSNEKLQELLNFGEERLKRIPHEEVDSYLSRLAERIANLKKVFSSESVRTEKNDFTIPFLSVLEESCQCLKLKHTTEGLDQIDFSLTMNPYNSGFPTAKDFHYLFTDKERAKEVLSTLPKKEQVIRDMKMKIFSDKPVEHEQILLKRIKYFSRVSIVEVLSGLNVHITEPEFKGEEKGKRYYIQDFYSLEGGHNLPVFYRMWFTQDNRYPALHDEDGNLGRKHIGLEFFLEQSRRGIEDPRALVYRINQQIDEINPKEIRKFTIGPYYDSITTNTPQLTELFSGIKNPSILKYKVEMVLSIDVREKPLRNFWETIKSAVTGRVVEKEVYSGVKTMDYGMVVPFRIAQKLRNKDECGQNCNIYGATEYGEVSC